MLNEIARNDFTVDARQVAPVAGRADERADMVAGSHQRAQHRRADETATKKSGNDAHQRVAGEALFQEGVVVVGIFIRAS